MPLRGRYIVPVEPATGRGDVVVVEVQQEGSRPLDVRLVGCEGESPYVAKISHGTISALRHKFKGSAEDWEAILSHFLLQKQPEGDAAKVLENVRVVYALKGDNIEIIIQQDIKGIKVNLGDILLPRDDEFEFNPFDWAQASAQAHMRSLKELAGVKAQASSEQDTIAKLSAQLDDLIQTKSETESAMLQQFMELLNEKKRKIRDQNRLLARAKVDKDTATAVEVSREVTRPRKAAASRTSKRKAKAPAVEAKAEPQVSDEEQMDVDGLKEPDEDQMDVDGLKEPDDESTPSQTETEDEDGDEDEGEGPKKSKTKAVVDEDVAPPPRRELPFAGGRGKVAAKQAPGEDEDEETEDEEL